MNPLYFGSSDSPLYGVYHPPKARQGRRTGLVLCYPFGQEYMRAHRAFRQLSLLLAKSGFHVFRFDYTGTGDSAGDSQTFGIAQALADTSLAIDEIMDSAEVSQVGLIGLRLGGTIACMVAAERTEVSALAIWDPIVSGSGYLDELLQDASGRSQPYGSAAGSGSGTLGVMGYPVTERLRRELRGIAAVSPPKASGCQSLVMCREETSEALRLTSVLGGETGRATFRHEPIQGRWDEVDNWGSAMIPQAAIQALVGWFAAEVR